LGDDVNVSNCLLVLTVTALAEGDFVEARALAEEALELARRTHNPMIEAYAQANIGVVLGVHGELDDAQRALEESIRRARELGNLRSVGSWTKALAGITLLQSNYPRARELFEQSLAILRSLDDVWGTLGSLSGLALVALDEQDNKSARRLLNENLELLRKSGHHYRAANSLEIAARLAAAQDRDRRAARLYGAASVVRRSMSIGTFECEVWPDPAPDIARLRSALGEPAFAETWAQGKAMTLDQSLAYALAEPDTERRSAGHGEHS
jgi:ATP/maltotriose-dependent transcriptional regulator MalT